MGGVGGDVGKCVGVWGRSGELWEEIWGVWGRCRKCVGVWGEVRKDVWGVEKCGVGVGKCMG